KQHALRHLGLNPRNLLVQGDRLWIANFGLVPLVWLPTGQIAGPLNARYAAPELFDRGDAPAADQYSLALIYTEMLSGVHPRPQRPGSGLVRRPGSNARGAPGARPQRIDLDLLPPADRDVVARGLDAAPDRRYPNCQALVDALDAA